MALANVRHTHIVEFHGDSADESMMLTETAYFSQPSFNSAFDVRFRADPTGRTVLFIGYSTWDINIRLLLHGLCEIWKNSGYERERPKSYVSIPAVPRTRIQKSSGQARCIRFC